MAAQFGFLLPGWPELHAAAARAEALARADARASAFHARRCLELLMAWVFQADARLSRPWGEGLAAMVDEPSFRAVAGPTIQAKALWLKSTGNRAVHSPKSFPEADARAALGELFHLCFWLARTYAQGQPPPDGLRFDPALLPPPAAAVARKSIEQLRALAAELAAKDAALRDAMAEKASLDEEVARLRAQVAQAVAASSARPDTHDYDEATTRDLFLDVLLREAGWDPDAPGVREVPVTGMPGGCGQGFCDYVLWGEDGRPLAVIEAKRTRHSPAKGQQQARLYADCLECMFGQRPVIVCSNGYEHWLWDDTHAPPRPVQGFFRRDELALMIQRRTSRRRLADAPISGTIVERAYQTRAIRRVAEAFEGEGRRRALLVMATGAGKTRTVIALADLLMRCNWAKRVLFLADRTALVKQAVNAFKAHLPDSAPVNLLEDKAAQGRVYVATYPTMLNLIEDAGEGGRRFGPGFFDLVVVDEAHRSIYRRYGAIFRWFDALLVGLTATPKDEVDANTYRVFGLENGMPTDAYGLEEAVKDGFLVPMRAVSVPLRFQREGIRYDQLPPGEREQWEETEWGEDGPPDRVEAEALNRWLFNADTVDKVLMHLMTHGQKVEGGDRLGKTIIFARNHDHAEFIQQRFDANYPKLRGHFARVIDVQVDYAQSLIDDFSAPAKAPHIAISVDMLDTGIDVPEIVNLVFFKPVRSRTKFWQMVGRGTRLRPDLFGPGQDKRFFFVFDVCQNLEFFSQDGPTVEGAMGESLSTRLFRARLALVGALGAAPDEAHAPLRAGLAETLRAEVAAMNVHNFIVRPHRRLVEAFAQAPAWAAPAAAELEALAADIAGLPTELEPERLEAKLFDLDMLRLQLCLLGAEAGLARLKQKVQDIAAALAEATAIPAIAAEIGLITQIQGEGWWEGLTAPEAEEARRRLRGLMHLIEARRLPVLYTDFADEIGEGVEVPFAGFVREDAFAKFREAARAFLRAHEDHVAINKLRRNLPLTPTDLAELERMLAEAGTAPELERAKDQGLGIFVRSLVGLDRAAAQEAFAGFLAGKTLNARQIEFVGIIIEDLTRSGVVEPGRLYESPYTRLSALGVDGVFPEADAAAIIGILNEVTQRAVA
ncbi:DEAD/DEAH box helicase family protein [Roseococcus sp. DSY-14]|uniref:DEAD/DEAH box helicase family protein n=1 Tax=Roseococcus sp. DSY-14 TaxID=3369650 RepID=UPI00387B3B11